MQLTEIKNDLATINYSPELNRLLLSDFILIEDVNQSILAQVISIEATMEDDVNSAMLKFLLSIDKDANLTQYSGYVPAKNSTLILINPKEVVQLIKGNDKNVEMGNLAAYPDIPVEVSLDFLRKKPYIQVDFFENKLQIVESVIRGLEKHNKKTILFDFSGLYSRISLPTVTLGYNFKLPLNYEALCYIADEGLNDCSSDNKAFIQGILIEIQNYVKSLPDKFIPFDTLISVLDAQYEEQNIPELLLLKNKLIKYQQLGIFAQDKSEFDFLNSFLKDAKNFKFDLSELPPQWQKVAFASILDNIKAKYTLIAEFTDDNSNKSIIKKVYEKSEIKPIILSSYNYKYQLQLKSLSKNLILFKPIHKVNDFAGYTSFLNILSQDTFIIWGEQTLFIPLILKANYLTKTSIVDDSIFIPKTENCENYEQEQNDNTPAKENLIMQNEIEDINVSELAVENDIDDNFENTNENGINSDENISEVIEVSDISADSTDESDNILENVEFKDNEDVKSNYIEFNDIQEFIPIEDSTEDTAEDYTENEINTDLDYTEEYIPEIKPDETDVPNSDDLDFFFNENPEINENHEESEVEEAVNYIQNPEDEINPVYEIDENQNLYTIDDENTTENFEEVAEENNQIYIEPENDISYTNENNIESLENIELDDNLQDISSAETVENNTEEINAEELVNDESYNNDENILISENLAFENTENTPDEETTYSTTDIDESQNDEIDIQKSPKIEILKASVPIYESKEAPQFNAKYAQGTYVYHNKYGRGVVEKVTNSGNKELCMIVFDKYGRKLLDPNITDLKQI